LSTLSHKDPEAEKDDKNWRKLNDCLNNPPAPGSSMSAERSASALSSAFGGDLSGNDLQSLLGSMNEQQIQQLLGISGLMPANSQSTSNDSSSQ
jgi:26S proteasome regulatory subunit N13